MANNVTLPGTGTVVAADDIAGVVYERVKLVDGTEDSTAVIPGTTANGLLVDPSRLPAGEIHLGSVGGTTALVTVTPTLTTHATYVSGDFVGTDSTPMSFALARVNAGSGSIISAILIDYAVQSIFTELWLFSATVTAPADSAAWSISDAHSLLCIGVIPFSTYYASALNSVSMGNVGAGIAFKAGAGVTTIFGCLVTRGAPAYASGDISITLGVQQD